MKTKKPNQPKKSKSVQVKDIKPRKNPSGGGIRLTDIIVTS